jgi:hypothetical protein
MLFLITSSYKYVSVLNIQLVCRYIWNVFSSDKLYFIMFYGVHLAMSSVVIKHLVSDIFYQTGYFSYFQRKTYLMLDKLLYYLLGSAILLNTFHIYLQTSWIFSTDTYLYEDVMRKKIRKVACLIKDIWYKMFYHHTAHGEVYSIKHYEIKFVSDLQQVSGLRWVLWFPTPIKLTATI